MMGVAAVCTALSAYLLGDVVNQAYVHKNFHALVLVGIAAFGLFALKGAATYGQQVIMMRIGNRIVADNQRRMFDKLLTENIGFFSDRHSSEFIARLTTGATAANLVLVAAHHLDRPRPAHAARPVRRDGDPGSGDVAGRPRRSRRRR